MKTAYTIHVRGPFDVRRLGGASVLPKGRKERALIAVLALSPDNRRSRKWVQNLLWSDRSESQGSSSLRQALTRIRKTLAKGPALLVADNQFVWLEPEVFQLATGHCSNSRDASEVCLSAAGDLLEGIDIRDEAFEEWLRDVRLANVILPTPSKPSVPSFGPVPSLQLYLGRPVSDLLSASAGLIASMLVDYLASEAMTLGFVMVADGRSAPSGSSGSRGIRPQTLTLNTNALDTETGTLVHVSVVREQDLRILWRAQVTLRPEDVGPWNFECGSIATRFVDFLIRFAAGIHDERPVDPARVSAALVMKGLFAPSTVPLPDMEEAIEHAMDLAPNGILFALRGTLSWFKFAERFGATRADVSEAIRHDMAHALERAPENGLMHALVGHAEGSFLANHAAALEMTANSTVLAPFSAVCWALHALSLTRNGFDERAKAASSRALTLGRSSFFRPFVEGACCICASARGDVEQAITHGEFAATRNPGFGSHLRYLFAAYAHAGRMDKAENVLRQWLRLEPDLSIRLLRSGDYPIAVPRGLEFIASAAEKFGL